MAPIVWIEMFQKTGDQHNATSLQGWLIQQLEETGGVTYVDLEWIGGDYSARRMMERDRRSEGRGMMSFHMARIAEVTPPLMDAVTGEETISIISNLEDENRNIIGKLQVNMSFEYLLRGIKEIGWSQGDKVFLTDNSGKLITQSEPGGTNRSQLGGKKDPLELAILKEMKKKYSGTILGKGHPPKQVAGFYKINQAPWTIVMFAPGKEILAPIINFRFYYAVFGITFVLLILVLVRIIGGKVVGSVEKISDAAGKVAKGDYDVTLPIKTKDEIGHLIDSFNTMVRGLKERDYISNTFGRYVDQEIAKELMRRPEAGRMGGEKREVAILMSDLRDFTPLAETLSPDETIKILNLYFSRMIDIIQKNKGIIVDFFGDALLVFFDPMDKPVEPLVFRAVECALQVQGAIKTFNSEGETKNLSQLKMGIGINAGEVVVGNIGSETRAKYGIVGSPVNITQRIQSNADDGEIIISQSVYDYVAEHFRIKRSFETKLKGIEEGITLYVIEETIN
jgi:class 3 adenylate cyclase